MLYARHETRRLYFNVKKSHTLPTDASVKNLTRYHICGIVSIILPDKVPPTYADHCSKVRLVYEVLSDLDLNLLSRVHFAARWRMSTGAMRGSRVANIATCEGNRSDNNATSPQDRRLRLHTKHIGKRVTCVDYVMQNAWSVLEMELAKRLSFEEMLNTVVIMVSSCISLQGARITSCVIAQTWSIYH